MSKVDWLRNLWKQPGLNRMVGNQNMDMTRFVTYLFRFMQIFKIDRFQIFSVTNTSVHALVGWPDDGRVDYDENEEVQEVAWDVQEFENYEDTFLLAEYLLENDLMDNDRIMIEMSELGDRIGWEKSRYDAAMNTLLEIKVDMIDDGKRTDFFFVHF